MGPIPGVWHFEIPPINGALQARVELVSSDPACTQVLRSLRDPIGWWG